MKARPFDLAAQLMPLSLALACLCLGPTARATTNIYFNASQTATVTASNITAITINSEGYLFTYSVDGYWAPYAGGTPTGRFFSVTWPTGVQAQSLTAGPDLGTGANITLKRTDGKRFNLQSFTGKILLNTAGAGGAFEVMPQLDGNDAFADPLMYDCTGYSGQSFAYTPALDNYDTYVIHMWGDFALTALTLTDTNPVVPVSNVTNTITASVSPVGAGTVGGAGDYPSNSTCVLTASANAGWGFTNWTQNGTKVSSSATYTFTVRSNRTLVANFLPVYTVTTAVSPSYGGTATGDGTFYSNATVHVTAVPATGFQFVNWTDYGTPVSTATNYSFTATGDHALTANFAPLPQTSLFDLDTGSPSVSAGQGMPGTQTANGLTATFSTVSGGWSIQTPQTSVIGAPPSFSGNFLYPSTWWSSFQIVFSSPVTNLAFDFLTGDVSSEYNTASTVRITAYTNLSTAAVGSGTAQGTWAHGAYPDGHINFSSATPFTIVRIDIAPVGVVSGLLFVDNLLAQRVLAPVVNYSLTTAASPPAGGTVTPGGTFAEGSLVPLTATPSAGYTFLDWLENGVPVSYAPSFDYYVTTNATLTAEFIANLPPVANPDTFARTQGLSLKISLADLLANDTDPDGDPLAVIDVALTTTNGFPLTWDGVYVYYADTNGAAADEFTYTIADIYGQTSTTNVTLHQVTPPPGQATSVNSLTGGIATVDFYGVPRLTYVAQRSTNLINWVCICTNVAPTGGVFSVQDSFPDLGATPSAAYYRLISP